MVHNIIPYFNTNDPKILDLNKKGFYILRLLINHETFYSSLPNTKMAKMFLKNGYIVIEDIKVENGQIQKKILTNICENVFGVSNISNFKLKSCILKGPLKDVQNELHLDRPWATIKWFLYLNDTNEDNGAFCYCTGSHKLNDKKLKFLYKTSLLNNSSPYAERHLYIKDERKNLGAIRVFAGNIEEENKIMTNLGFQPPKSFNYRKTHINNR